MRLCASVLLFALLLLGLLGCGGDDRLVGTWDYSDLYTTGTYRFGEDGTFEMKGAGQGRSVDAKGHYELKGEELLLQYNSWVDEKGQDLFAKEELRRKSKPASLSVEWKGDTEVMFHSHSGPPQTLKKK